MIRRRCSANISTLTTYGLESRHCAPIRRQRWSPNAAANLVYQVKLLWTMLELCRIGASVAVQAPVCVHLRPDWFGCVQPFSKWLAGKPTMHEQFWRRDGLTTTILLCPSVTSCWWCLWKLWQRTVLELWNPLTLLLENNNLLSVNGAEQEIVVCKARNQARLIHL